ncbi:ABC transporter-like [Macleaya cordata]|uniref:ABC transporter-like n=1 Tax=Macleaya cordata TaxID=56857 RepID=A0A200R1R9_MACCD|nr:ABC transporter-like [Macleaya cordata]
MAHPQLIGSTTDEIESLRIELAEIGRSMRSSFRHHTSSFRSTTSTQVNSVRDVEGDDDDDESAALQWAAIDRLPTFEKLRYSLFDDSNNNNNGGDVKAKRVIDVTKLGPLERHMFIEKLIKHIENDNLRLLQNFRERIDKVGVKLPTVEVRYTNLYVEAECEVVHGKPLPTLWNSLISIISVSSCTLLNKLIIDYVRILYFSPLRPSVEQGLPKLLGVKSQEANISIIKDVSGIIKPGRMTLLLGPPGCGKTTFLLALSGKLDQSLKVTGEISYNGYKLEEFVPQKTSAYISQYDLHIPEMTVRETLDFSACCQGVGSRADIMLEVCRREKQAGIVPDPDLDTYMKAISVDGQKRTLQTDYILKILGLDICADTFVGDAMRRGLSGGQKKRLTTGREMIVGPTKALFMDEISNGLDSSTTFQVVAYLQQLVHITDATALVSLLQPAPETYDLFDDIILMAEGKVVYHGPRSHVLDFFEDCGFKCPERKGAADFLQEVISKKDQGQYWYHTEQPYSYISVDQFCWKFKACKIGKKLDEEISERYDKSQSHKDALSFSMYSLSKWELFKACMTREFLLMRRNSFIYVFKTTQLVIIASITMTVFLRTRMHVDVVHANYFLGSLFYALIILLVDGLPELSMTVSRLAVFYKQRELCFYPAWAYAIPAAVLKVPLSFLESIVWTVLTYYVIGYSPEFGRFIRQFFLLFAVHLASISMFRFIASIFQTLVSSVTAGSFSILFVLLFGGFVIPQPSMPAWLQWGFWLSPLTYGEIGITVNEFLAPRWQHMSLNTTLGRQTLESRGLNFDGYFYWVSLVALFGFSILFNIGFTLALSFLKPPGMSRAIISHEKLSQIQGREDYTTGPHVEEHPPRTPKNIAEPMKGGMILPFVPQTVAFRDVQYFIDTPLQMKERGFTGNRIQLLRDITGAFMPGVLTALMGVSGAGKTTLLDVLSGRKTGGTIEGNISIGGYPKSQDTYSRISGYCEQTDIHSPQITVEESVIYSAWLRLPRDIDSNTKDAFVNEVLETIELDGIKDALVGIPGVSGLSTEQRKRLTIAVELVANPSIIFMDEPTSGLDARAAAIVMRAVKNVVNTGRTVVCTIHQPSIDIFEAFDELILLKRGGRIIYSGPLGQHSSRVIEYFEGISGVPRIRDNYNPATWILEVSSMSAEVELGIDFAHLYRESTLYKEKNELVKQLCTPPPGSEDLHFATRFPQSSWGQFKACLWKQHLSYWRSPAYNLMRIMHMIVSSLLFGLVFWQQGRKINSQQSLFNVFGSMFSAVIFLGINNCSSVLPFVSTERTVLYRERFAGMYSSWAYAFAQVAVEIPYLFTQSVLYVIITYPMIGYSWSFYKVFWSFYAMFCTLLYFNYLGMLVVSITPNVQVASILSSSFFTMLNLFSGFPIPKPRIPKWWVWAYYMCPTSWTLNGLLTSQYGDMNKEILVFGETKTVSEFLRDYFGFQHDHLGIMAHPQLVGTTDEVESLRIELADIGRSMRSSFRYHTSSFRSTTSTHVNSVRDVEGGVDDDNENTALQWAAIERLPTFRKLRSSLFDDSNGGDVKGKRMIDVTKLGPVERHLFIEKLIKHIENDNLRLLQNLRERIDKVGVKLPTVEVQYMNLCVEAECEVVHGKPLPTLWNSLISIISGLPKLLGVKSQEANINIIKDVSGTIKPGRMTLLLGPPGCGKTTFLLALSGKLDPSLKVKGEIAYNGYKLEEFVPQKTSAYISQYDLHIPEMTVRETLDFSACCQGVGSRADIMLEVCRREKQAGIVPDPDLDTYMKAISVDGLKRTLQTDYILKILGLDICADTLVGDAMRRGISGGQKKRLTTGREMIVGPTKALFMDEISNGLDSSTTFQVVAYLQQLVHITDATALVSLLQPAPETYDLFDDIILMAEGKVVYHGPRTHVLNFFENCGFKCPERKGAADFLQEVILSVKDQGQYWYRTEEPYSYVSVDDFSRKFKESNIGRKLDEELSKPYDKSQSHKDALSFSKYSLSNWELFKACMSREFLLMRRNSFIYVFKTSQLVIIASITMTVFLRTRMHVDVVHANYYMGSLFYALLILLVDGFPELSMTVSRLAVFYKQRELCLYPAWAYAIPAAILKVPLSFLESIVWTTLTYYVIGFSPEFGRFIRQFVLLFAVHLASISMFRFIASIFQTVVASVTAGSFSIVFVLLFGGFVVPQPSMPAWLKWGFWVSPLTYGEIGITVNEFLAPRWQHVRFEMSLNTTLGRQTLESRGLNFDGYFYWISLGALFGFSILFNIGFTLALSFLKPPGMSRAIISHEKLSQIQGREDYTNGPHVEEKPPQTPKTIGQPKKGGMVLPFVPLTVAFRDVQYYIDTPLEMKERGFTENRLQLLQDITGAFLPGVLTALMGVSGAGKTTLLDVLSGRKTGGTIEGNISIGGYPKSQETYSRISGYCEQTDIHSPQITVEESVIYSAWLRLPSEIDSNTKNAFVNEVLETIELDGIKDALVGTPGVSGLSTEQRKRLTIAVELVANPSIIYMDEPTSGLDARAAAIVMRAVKNVVNTGRTVVCTIHQPSIDIFEAFDELILMKLGGRIIYSGPLGQHSSRVIEYFEGISGVPRIKDNYNPATWMLEVTSTSAEVELGVDFAHLYRESTLYKEKNELVKQLCTPPPGSKDLHFATRFPQSSWGQFKACLWKQHLSYWRSPAYNLMRIMHMIFSSLLFGLVFWQQGKKINNQQSLFNIFGSMFSAVIFLGINNCSSVLPFVSTERNVLYRERFAGMYSSWAYAFSQVVIEIPYLFTESVLYVIITYPMIGYFWSPYKVFWSFYAMFCTLLYYNYLGMLLVSITPNVQVASILSSAFYTMMTLFSGFPIPKPQIPKWWVWFYYVCPTSWTLNGLLTSQYGDIDNMEILVFGETKTVSEFLRDYFGFHHDHLGIVAILLLVFPILFASLFAYCIGKLNFQRR